MPDSAQSGADLITAERQRQIDAKGWTLGHDDTHTGQELKWAAVHYLGAVRPGGEIAWPWIAHGQFPRPHGELRNLVKAGALIAAEIDRLQRQEAERA